MEALSEGLKEQIIQDLQSILTSSHSDYQKQTIKYHNDRMTFACPYCGDSTTNMGKKRGNLYWANLYFHCYNDGCMKHTSYINMLSDHHLNMRSDDDHFFLMDYIKANKKEFKRADNLNFSLFKELNSHGIDLDDFRRSFNVYDINERTYRAYPYLKSRLLHNKVENFMYDPRKKLLYVLNKNRSGTKILGCQVRALDQKMSTGKYFTYKLSKIYSQINVEVKDQQLDIDPEKLELLDKLSMVFGILSADFTSTYNVFEGPIDSLFMKNSIALTGIDKMPFDFDEIPTTRYFFDNDKAGKTKMIEKLEQHRTVFLWDKFLRENSLLNYKIKDLNDLIKVIYKYKLKLTHNINEYFTDDVHDMMYI